MDHLENRSTTAAARGRQPAVDVDKRRQNIVDAARSLAEKEGWEAVTARRLASTIGFSQPVIYWHFAQGLPEVRTAVALDGFAELADDLEAISPSESVLAALARTYLDFAATHPATYRAMFETPLLTPFGTADAPDAAQRCFTILRAPIAATAASDAEAETQTEVFWSALHGLAALDRDGRLRPEARNDRLSALLARFG